MSTPNATALERSDNDKSVFGFWIYIMTDCVLFASLFATYAVLRNNTNGGPGASELFSLPYVLAETLILLTSSFTIGLALLAAHRQQLRQSLAWLTISFVLGAMFVGLELNEFVNLVQEGHSWTSSGFLTAFFTLVGTHGLHITIGLIWIAVMAAQLLRKGFAVNGIKRLTLLSLFWHFLDIVWVFIFTIVYLLGVMS